MTSDDNDDTVLSVSTIGIDVLPAPEVAERGLVFELVKDEVVRAAVAVLLLGLLAIVVVIAMLRAKTWADTKQLLDVVLPAITALLGSAIGFYFGTKTE